MFMWHFKCFPAIYCTHINVKPVKYSGKKYGLGFVVGHFTFCFKGSFLLRLVLLRIVFVLFFLSVLIVCPTLMSFTCLINLPSLVYLSLCPFPFAHFFFWCLMLWSPRVFGSMFFVFFLITICLIFCLILDCLLILALACLTTHKPCLLSLIN